MCAHNVFLKFFLQFWFFYDCLTILRRVRFFTAYSVDVGDFLPHTQQTQEIFYRILIVIAKETKWRISAYHFAQMVFLVQSSCHLSRWDRSVLKSWSRISHAWAPLTLVQIQSLHCLFFLYGFCWKVFKFCTPCEEIINT